MGWPELNHLAFMAGFDFLRFQSVPKFRQIGFGSQHLNCRNTKILFSYYSGRIIWSMVHWRLKSAKLKSKIQATRCWRWNTRIDLRSGRLESSSRNVQQFRTRLNFLIFIVMKSFKSVSRIKSQFSKMGISPRFGFEIILSLWLVLEIRGSNSRSVGYKF